MGTSVGVGESREIESFKAGAQAARMALDKSGHEKCDFLFVFATAGHDQKDLLQGIHSVTGDTPLSGCTGEGIITQSGPNEDMFGLGIMAIKSDQAEFHNTIGYNLREDSEKAGEQVGKQLKKDWPEDPKALFMFPDGLSINTKAFFTGITNILKEPIPFIGGISADNWKMVPELNWEYHNGKAFQNAASCVLMSGKLNVEIGVNHGCTPLGIERTVTRAVENRIFEVDNKPAFEVFKDYSDENVNELTPELVVHLCYGETLPNNITTGYDKYIIRTPLTHDKKDGSITIPTEMPTGTKFILMRRDTDKIISEISRVARKIKDKLKDKSPRAILHFNCAGRGKILFGRDAHREIESVQEVFGKDIPWLGFYCYGEIAPIACNNFFHNYTAILAVIY
ncbi:MAG: FIST C-terminal domain-containing protein [Spirochaetes bacterium]|nr:FIST C-terminal domain-containing protein [Spirochaetota bacterium]